jgi:hypothetical protein
MVSYLRLAGVGALALFIVAGVGLVFVQRAKLDAAEAERATLQLQIDSALATNKLFAESIDRLSQQRAIDERFVALLNSQLSAIRTDAETTANKLTELERTNPDVKGFLATPLPVELKRVLGR